MKGQAPNDFFIGGGEMSERTQRYDWSQTPCGPLEDWPQGLKTAVRIMLGSRYAMWLGWGPELTFLYNDAYAEMTLGPKHPWALGRPAVEVWSEIWDDIGPRAESVIRTGEATWDEGLLLFLERRGFPEETYHTFSYSPLPSDDGSVGGMLCVVTEETERTIGERRLRTLRELAARTADEAKSAEEACRTAAKILERHSEDLPFALLYLVNSAERQAKLAGYTGLDRGTKAAPDIVDLEQPDDGWPLRQVATEGVAVEVTDVIDRFGKLSTGPWPEPPQQAMVLPLVQPGQAELAGFLVAGVSPRRPFDDAYRGFFDLLAGQISTAIANARAYEEERRRAEALTALDRAKTAFFSNVSHEFRTPLTLMLGPLEALLSDGADLSPESKSQLEVINRNGLRLLRLVNSLLDFSRIEAGRVRAIYQPTDLAALTVELASVFRAAVERAGMRLVVDCPPLDEPVFVERDMWEKIVLNLLSNAFKFTLEGEITLTQKQVGDRIELTVKDTGTGIAADEMPRLFERFHRIENSRARTHEGSGIGLALVKELVQLHGGSITAESVLGEGTTFTVSIPMGSEHLPSDQISEYGDVPSRTMGATPYLEEALRWLPDAPEGGDGPQWASAETAPALVASNGTRQTDGEARPVILLADDNADMRRYVQRLLAERYSVITVPEGQAALEAAQAEPPDLVLTDVMMPRLDGLGLLRELRSNPRTADIPIIMLSARAGEESRIEGMEAGADDYLVKPFSSKELLARVGAHLQIARERRESAAAVREGKERLQMALESARMVAWKWDLSEDRVDVSDNFSEVFGLPASEAADSGKAFKLVHPDDVAEYRAVVDSAIKNCCGYHSQFRVIRPDNGNVIWMEVTGRAVADSSGAAGQLIGVIADITERKEAAEALERERDLLRVTLTSIGDAVITTDSELRITNMNSVAESLTGWSVEEARAKPLQSVFRIINEDTRQPVKNPAEKALREGVVVGLANHTILIMKDGSERPLDDSAAPIRNADGSIVGCVLVFRDVTERRTAENRLRRSEERYRALVAASAQIVWSTDPEGKVEEDSPSWRRFTGQTYDQVKGWGRLDAVHPDDLEIIRAAWRTGIETKSVSNIEYRLRRYDGEYRWTAVRLVPVLNADSSVREWVGANTDITDLKRAEAEKLERAKVVALRADVSSALASVQPLQAGLQNCCEALVSHLDVALARVWTYEAADEKLVLLAGAGRQTHPGDSRPHIPVGHAEIERLVARETAQLTDDVWRDLQITEPEWAEREALTAFAGYPLVVDEQVVGIVAMFAERPFSPEILSDIAPLIDQIAQYIDRKRAEEALSESELRYRLVGQAANDVIWDWNLQTNEVIWSEGIHTRFGYSPEQVIPDASWWEENIHPEDQERVVHGIHHVIDGQQELWQDEYRYRLADGSYATVFDRGRVVRNEAGIPVRMVGSMFDLTERLQAEQDLNEQRKQYRGIFESTSDAILVFNRDGLLLEANPAACKLHGYTYDELIGMHGSRLVHPDEQGKFFDFVGQVSEGREFHVDGVHVRKDGGLISVVVTGASFIFAGQPALLAVLHDVTEQRKALEALRESEEKLRLLADTIPQLAWMARPDGHIFWYNSRWYEYTGKTPAEMEGWGWQSVHDPEVLPDVLAQWRHSIATGEPLDMVFPLKGADGEFRPFLTRVNSLRGRDGEIRFWFGTNTDISEEKRTQEQLRELAARLSDADRRKNEFLATLAHELRNPLAPIRNGLEVMKMLDHDPAAIAKVRDTMERQTGQLVTLVDDLMNVSRITSGKLELRKTAIVLQEVVGTAVEAALPLIKQAQHELKVSLPDQPVMMEADPNRLAQILSNLLDNAAKYTPTPGVIRLSAEVEQDEVVLTVADSGMGIPVDMLDHIFEMFGQVDRPYEKGYTGLGIGLTLVKSLVEMHGGKVSVHSDGPDQGSEFSIRLPVLPDSVSSTRQSGPEVAGPPSQRRRVLVVDDNRAAAEMIHKIVELLGHEVRVAYDGEQAVSLAGSYRPDVVLMDLGMPRVNGYEAARRIRQQPWGAGITLVALTGWGQDQDKVRTTKAGFDRHLVKPVDAASLRQILAEDPPSG